MKRGEAAISIYGCLHAAFFLIGSHHEAQSPRPRIRSCLGGWSISRRGGGQTLCRPPSAFCSAARLSACSAEEMEGPTEQPEIIAE